MKRELYAWLVIGLLMWGWALSVRGVTLQWDYPTDTTDIVGYRLYWGAMSGGYLDSSDAGLANTITVPDDRFVLGTTYFFVARSYTADGIESVNSNEVSWTRPLPPEPTPTPFPTPSPTPSPPQNLHFQLVVINGRGSGSYEPGTLVLVIADKPPPNYAFSRWEGDWVILANPFKRRIKATIPYHDVSIEATYEPSVP